MPSNGWDTEGKRPWRDSTRGSSGFLASGKKQLLGLVIHVEDAKSDTFEVTEKLCIREPIRGMLEEMAREPIVVSYIVIL